MGLAAAWGRWYGPKAETTALSVAGPPPILARDTAGVDVAIADEVDIETPGNPEWTVAVPRQAVAWARVIVLAAALAAVAFALGLREPAKREPEPGPCTVSGWQCRSTPWPAK